ncbi:hypothetical protein ACFOQM_22295 [Paenibacillus sp. GCM10012307]|uniref:Lipoprotein n=1 Tax=Paenibacillus roseus TaxID=2798579 RepID=A0A934J3A3_9BACL|nr:hypothetical protein [Paenibacillus roseus]MBJ6363962.1 hypothetical protein [Paenibacillus roseus]
MKKTKTAIVFLVLIGIFTILLGCKSSEDLTQSTSEEKSDLPIDHSVSIDKGSSQSENPIPTETTNDQQPQYIDESKYEGDELGIVKTLNKMQKALYEKDVEAYNSIIAEDGNREKAGPGFKMYFISFDTLDFTVKPEPTPPEGAIPVWIEYTEKVYGRIEKDKQLFTFVFEDDAWKLLYVADYLRF